MIMQKSTPILNILTKGLSGDVTHPIYLEYNSRRKELDRIWVKSDNHYQMLLNHVSTVEALLAISLFYRHVMGYMQGATSFYISVNQRSVGKECAISIGKSVFDKNQQNHLLAAVIRFNKIQNKYQLSPAFFEYSENIQFLRNCRDLFNLPEYEEDDTI